MKKITYHLFIAILISSFVSCIGPAEPLKIPEAESVLVVDGTFTNDQFFQVVLSKTRSGSEPIYVDNAEVQILSESDDLLETLTFYPANEKINIPCYASLDLKPEIGKLYKIRVETPNYPITTAESLIPFPSGLDAGNYIGENDLEVETTRQGVYLSVAIEDNNHMEKNYFHISLYHLVKVKNTDGVIGEPISRIPMKMRKFGPSDPGVMFADNTGVLLTDNSFANSKTNLIYKAEFDQEIMRNLVNKDNYGRILVELRTVNESYFNFMNTYIEQQLDDTRPLLYTSQDFTNVINGRGLFSGFSSKTDTISINQ